jgi:uncharacterized protein YqjF (DUF2071 family)
VPDGALRVSRPFLTARWEDLVLLNYTCPRELLDPLVPDGTTLDDWRGEYLVSIVGFMFRDTRVIGLPIPFHRTFEEVNLRVYVRRIVDDEVRRAVVFIRELVPRRAIAEVARAVYNEPYVAVSMSHQIDLDEANGGVARYSWRYARTRFELRAVAQGESRALEPDSEAEFITEHYWGYTRQRDGRTLEYRVEHPRWRVWDAVDAAFDAEPGAVARLYGAGFARMLATPPRSAFIACGSEVAVFKGRVIDS